MNLVLVIGGAWLALIVVVGAALSRIGRRLNQHVPLPKDAEEADAEPPEPGPGQPAG
ncbi:MAG TPA: hypothetical protein VFU73_14435 [Actinocrinis sp.]|nr:hypothetical protein [Actinocrinis sp.]